MLSFKSCTLYGFILCTYNGSTNSEILRKLCIYCHMSGHSLILVLTSAIKAVQCEYFKGASEAHAQMFYICLSKTTPILITSSSHWTMPSRSAKPQAVGSGCLEHDHYYHQALGYVNQWICIAKHFIQWLWPFGGVATPCTPPPPPKKKKSTHDYTKLMWYTCMISAKPQLEAPQYGSILATILKLFTVCLRNPVRRKLSLGSYLMFVLLEFTASFVVWLPSIT